MYPIDDYPDIFFIYKQMIKNNNYFSIANSLNFFDLFEKYACYVSAPSNRILNYLIGGGTYVCSNFPLSITYIYFFLAVTLVFIFLLYFFYKLLRNLKHNQKEIFKLILLNLLLLPSTTFFILSFHIDIPYHFLTISFVLQSFYLSFKNNYLKIYLIYLILFLFIYNSAPDNQGFIFLAIFFCSLISIILSRNKYIQELCNIISWQIKKLINLKFDFSRRFLIYFLMTFTLIIGGIIIYRIQILEYIAYNDIYALGEVTKIAKVYINPSNVEQYSLLFKYPIYIRVFGALQGLIIFTPFGIKPSIFSTLLFLTIFAKGLIKLFSLENKTFPIYIKIFFLTCFVMMIFVLSIFPFFSYSKYWVFFLPFLALFMTFSKRLSLIAILFIYIELIFKSHWI